MSRTVIWLLVLSAAILVVQTASTSWWMFDSRREARQLHGQLSDVVGKVRDDFKEKCTADGTLATVKLAEALKGLSDLESRLEICDQANQTARAGGEEIQALRQKVTEISRSLKEVPENVIETRNVAQATFDKLPADPTWFSQAAGALEALLACDHEPELCGDEGRLALAAALQALTKDVGITRKAVTEELPGELFSSVEKSAKKSQEVLETTAKQIAEAFDGPSVARRDLLSYARTQAAQGASAVVEEKSLRIILGRPTGFTCEDFDVAVGAYRNAADPALAPGIQWTDKILVDYLGPMQAVVEFNYTPMFNLTIRKQLTTENDACVAQIAIPQDTADELARSAGKTRFSIEILMPARHRIENLGYRVARTSP